MTLGDETNKPHLLLVEDDDSLAEWIQRYLCGHGYRVSHASRGDQGLAMIFELTPDLVILDVLLPNMSGLDVCQKARPHYRNPILFLTACAEEMDEVVGLELGADDYLSKPIKPRVLLARIKALLRRSESGASERHLHFGALSLSADSKSVTLGGKPIAFTSGEFDTLWLLASQAGRVVTREDLVTQLRGLNYDGLDRSIDLRISRLRKKLGDNTTQPTKIKTVWAKGYLFVPDTW